MKVLFLTDLHGCKWKYERLFETARKHQADMVINGGDMLPKGNSLFAQGNFIASYLDNHFVRFDSAGIYYLCYLGNDDLIIFDELLEKICSKYSHVFCLAQRKFRLRDCEFIGLNWVVDYPFRLKDRCRMDTKEYVFQKQLGTGLLSTPRRLKEIDDWFSYARTFPTMEDELDRLVRPESMSKSIYVIHMPPYKLGLDKCAHGEEVGSKAVYDFMKEHQPMLSLHGHIHESPQVTGRWHSRINRTICIQPGQLDELTYVIIDLACLKFDRIVEKCGGK